MAQCTKRGVADILEAKKKQWCDYPLLLKDKKLKLVFIVVRKGEIVEGGRKGRGRRGQERARAREIERNREPEPALANVDVVVAAAPFSFFVFLSSSVSEEQWPKFAPYRIFL